MRRYGGHDLPWPAQMAIVAVTLAMVGSSVFHGHQTHDDRVHAEVERNNPKPHETGDAEHVKRVKKKRQEQAGVDKMGWEIMLVAGTIVLGGLATAGASFGRRLGRRLLEEEVPQPEVVAPTLSAARGAENNVVRGLTVESSRLHTSGAGAIHDPVPATVSGITPVAAPKQHSVAMDLSVLADYDPAFSEWPFRDFVSQVQHRATYAAVDHQWAGTMPFVAMSMLHVLRHEYEDLSALRDLVSGRLEVTKVEVNAKRVFVTFRVPTLRTEVLAGRENLVYTEEYWVFQRNTGVSSPPPDRLGLCCPHCGAEPAVSDAHDRCEVCGEPLGTPAHWQAMGLQVRRRTRVDPPRLPDGDAESAAVVLTAHEDLARERRALASRHPSLTDAQIVGRVEQIVQALANSRNRVDTRFLGAFCTPAEEEAEHFQQRVAGLAGQQLHEEDAGVEKVALLSVRPDGWYENLELQVWIRARRWITDEAGAVLSGSAERTVLRSERWVLCHPYGAVVVPDGWKLARVEGLG